MREATFSQAVTEIEEMKRALSTPAGAAMMDRLIRFCRVRETCVVAGNRDLSYVFEGRRQVYLYLQDHIELTSEEFLQRYATIKLEARSGAHGNDDQTIPPE